MDGLRELMKPTLVDKEGTAQFFVKCVLEQLRATQTRVRESEFKYAVSILAHNACTSTASHDQVISTSGDLKSFFDLFCMDRSEFSDPEVLEIAGAQALFLTGFFRDQMKGRHPINFYMDRGKLYYSQASMCTRSQIQSDLFGRMSDGFRIWSHIYARVSRDLRQNQENYRLLGFSQSLPN